MAVGQLILVAAQVNKKRNTDHAFGYLGKITRYVHSTVVIRIVHGFAFVYWHKMMIASQIKPMLLLRNAFT